MNKVFLIGFLCIASSLAFELPIVFDIGNFQMVSPLLNHDVLAAGPFATARNVTLNFQWETEDSLVVGVRIRGSEPRYDRISVTVNRLDSRGYDIDVTATNTNFVLFWAEPHGYPDTLAPEPGVKSIN